MNGRQLVSYDRSLDYLFSLLFFTIMGKLIIVLLSLSTIVHAQWWKPISNNPAVNPKAPPVSTPGDSKAPTSAGVTRQCGRPKNSPDALWSAGSKIVGGVEAQQESWPWVVALIQFKPTSFPPVYHFCGGSIIGDRWILTAGHCVDNHEDSYITTFVKAVVGLNDLSEVVKNPDLLLSISKVFHHPQYDDPKGTTNNDVALLQLEKPLNFTSRIQPVCLPTHSAADLSTAANTDKEHGGKKVAFVAGWGHLSEEQRQSGPSDAPIPLLGAGTDKLQQVGIDLYGTKECEDQLKGYLFTESMLCGGFPEGGKDSCQGDSGGPLVAKDKDDHYEQIGVVSWGLGCAREGIPGIYANVHKLRNWIDQIMATNQ